MGVEQQADSVKIYVLSCISDEISCISAAAHPRVMDGENNFYGFR